MKINRVFLIVLDSLGIGEMPDSALYGDKGSNTLKSCFLQKDFYVPNLQRLGLFNIDGIDYGNKVSSPLAAYGRMTEASKGKDTTIGHWEICGVISPEPLPTYPNGFPKEIIDEFAKRCGRGVLCNKPYSGTKVIADFGEEHLKTGKLIVYTSADSVFQIAAHEDIVSKSELYGYCKIARDILKGKHGVGRVIARPFSGEHPFRRSSGRHDFSLVPPKTTLIDELKNSGFEVIPVGKIYDIFAGKSLESSVPTVSNLDGMQKTSDYANKDFNGLCFTNLVDFDMVYGHRNDAAGYAKALSEFDLWLGDFMKSLRSDDVLIITADHGCDPLTESTDHSREYTPLLIYGNNIKPVNLGTRKSFADTGKTVGEMFGIKNRIDGEGFLDLILKEK